MKTSATKKKKKSSRAGSASGAPTEREVRDAVLTLRADRLLAWAEAADGPAARRWLLEALDEALARVDPGSLAPRDLERARSLGADVAPAAPSARPPHAVVVPFTAGSLGLARGVVVSFELDAGLAHESLGADARRAVGDALAAAAREVPPPQPIARFRMDTVQAGGLEGLAVDGASLGAPVLVSAVSLFSGRPVRRGVAVTGVLRGGRVADVSGLAAKIDALAARADVERLVVAASQRADAAKRAGRRFEVVGVADVAALLDASLERDARREEDPDLAVAQARHAFGRGWQGWQWPRVRERLERLALAIPEGRPDLRVATLTMLGAARRHLGAPEDAWRILRNAADVADAHESELPDAPRAHLEEHLALAALWLFDLRAARAHAARALRVARRARLAGEQLKALGCVGLVAQARGDAEAAASAQRAALELVHRHRPATCARSHAYLVDALALAGDLPAARREHDEAVAHLSRVADAAARTDAEGWLRVTLGGALVRHGAHDEALRVLDVDAVHRRITRDPLPGLHARRHLARALAADRERDRGNDRERAWDLLAGSPAAHRDAGPRHLALAWSNVLWEARLRAEHDALDDDARARALHALDVLPREGALPKLLDAPTARARAALSRSAAAPLVTALDALLSRLERVGL